MSGGRVPYDEVAHRYHHGRALSAERLAGWWRAIQPWVPATTEPVVLDLGAGTGIFSAAWRQWCGARVVAIEPSAGMRSESVAAGACIVGGAGEALPLRDASVDVAWLSAVLHHLVDVPAVVDGLHRTVRERGVVFIRELFRDRGEVGWLRFFPGAERARAQFPSLAATTDAFAAGGFSLVSAVDVDDGATSSAPVAAAWAREMRHADSLLRAFTDEEFEAGVAALEAAAEVVLDVRLTLLAFRAT